MNRVKESDWVFRGIREADEARATWLESAGPPDALISALVGSIDEAFTTGCIRIAIDSIENLHHNCRAIIQFRIDRKIYDWFFNARTGYRAQYWVSPDTGIDFNNKIVKALSFSLDQHLPRNVEVRRINVNVINGFRQEDDAGIMTVPRQQIFSSLSSQHSKIWIAERRYDGPKIAEIGFAVLTEAERDLPKLCIPRWAADPVANISGEGLRAPCPDTDNSWLDLKGAFQEDTSNFSQIKPQDLRAKQIHRCGWT